MNSRNENPHYARINSVVLASDDRWCRIGMHPRSCEFSTEKAIKVSGAWWPLKCVARDEIGNVYVQRWLYEKEIEKPIEGAA